MQCVSWPLSTASTSLSMASLIMRGQMKNWAHLEKNTHHHHLKYTIPTLWLWSITLGVPHCSESGVTYLSRASRNLFLCTSNWNTVLSQSVEALSLPPCFFRNASNPFSRGYFWLPINTTDPGRGGGGWERLRQWYQTGCCDLGHSPYNIVSFIEILHLGETGATDEMREWENVLERCARTLPWGQWLLQQWSPEHLCTVLHVLSL